MNYEVIKRTDMEHRNGPVKITRKMEPTYKRKHKVKKKKITLETARYLTDMRIAKHLNNIF